ncbi:ABC transporter ATP-binding protein/permease [Limibaculum sp. M0105]|uniref:ABC transporter ATP-binding protein/permease n=2 Tax=Thermohalobaculum xanthum TaxID=2753746 RepID=A0A8J7M477_9RHOB|nr:ABC transporter ATP-binding protein/permease [Thermohalobaculum xanthum]
MTQTLPPPVTPADHRLGQHLKDILGAIHRVPGHLALYALCLGVVAVIGLTAVAQVALNAWNEPFYSAVQSKDLDGFLRQLVVFAGIAGVLLFLNVAQTSLNQLIRLKLRALVTRDLIETWMTRKRAARIGRAGEIGVNPDQRIHADAHHLAEVSTDLGVGLLQSTVLLFSFIGVLWVLSRSIVLPIGGEAINIPGYLVWAALLYALSGSWLSWRMGRRLVPLEVRRYGREADLRVALVRGAAQADGIALSSSEPDERRQLDADLGRVLAISGRIVLARVPLTFVTVSYGWVAIIAPFVLAAPGYFGQALSFGELMMVVGAFIQVQQALRWFVDNTGAIADWRATLSRVMDFRAALLDLEKANGGQGRLERADHPEGKLELRGLVVTNHHGSIALSEPVLALEPGERVLLTSPPGTGKTTLFLAIAGLWERGTGRISAPPEGETMFLSQRPFVPAGTLRRALTCWPSHKPCDDARLAAALERAGLGHLASSLDRVERWDRDLTASEQERIGYARLLVNRPKWLISDDALAPVDEANREILLGILATELAESAVLNIASSPLPQNFYSRIVRLIVHPLDRNADLVPTAAEGIRVP